MQRVEINPNLSKEYIQIARGLKEIKETAYRVSLAAKRVLPVLQEKKAAGGLSEDDGALLDDAITHYSAIANNEDAWPEITTLALETEESIRQLFALAIDRLQKPQHNKEILNRLAAYAWIVNNVGDLNKLLYNTSLSVDDTAVVQDLYQPVPRIAQLKLFLDGFKNGLTEAQKKILGPVIDPLHTQVSMIAGRIDRFAPAVGFSMSEAADLMIQKLDLFALKDKDKEFYECELEDLALVISTVQNVGNFKERLEQLHKRISDDVIEQKIEGKTTDEITHSTAMQLCRYTHRMLDVVLNNKETADNKLIAIKNFKGNYEQLPNGNTFLKCLAAVVIAAVVSVLVLAAIVGIASIIGTFVGGPAGTVAAAVAALVEGTVTATGIGVAVASAATGITVSAAVSVFSIFKTNPLSFAAGNVKEEALDYKDYAPSVAAAAASA